MAASVPAILRDLPLEHIIGGPLEAAIKAQAMAARMTADFINTVGLTPPNAAGQRTAQMVDFDFDRTIEERNPPAVAGGPVITNFRIIPSKLTVPMLAIVPTPFIRINDMTIDFEYELHDVETTETSKEMGVEASVEASYWCVKAQVKGSYSNKTNNKRETDQRVTLRITVHASEQSMPEGLARVLDMMHDQLKVVPLSTGTLLAQPTARIDSIDPKSIPTPAAGGAAVTIHLHGENLDNPTGVVFNPPYDQSLTATLPGGGVATTSQVDIQVSAAAAVGGGPPPPAPSAGTAVVVLKTPQGNAQAQLVLT